MILLDSPLPTILGLLTSFYTVRWLHRRGKHTEFKIFAKANQEVIEAYYVVPSESPSFDAKAVAFLEVAERGVRDRVYKELPDCLKAVPGGYSRAYPAYLEKEMARLVREEQLAKEEALAAEAATKMDELVTMVNAYVKERTAELDEIKRQCKQVKEICGHARMILELLRRPPVCPNCRGSRCEYCSPIKGYPQSRCRQCGWSQCEGHTISDKAGRKALCPTCSGENCQGHNANPRRRKHLPTKGKEEMLTEYVKYNKLPNGKPLGNPTVEEAQGVRCGECHMPWKDCECDEEEDDPLVKSWGTLVRKSELRRGEYR